MRSTLAIAAIAIGLLCGNAEAQIVPQSIATTYNFNVVSFPQALAFNLSINGVNDNGAFTGNYTTSQLPMLGLGVNDFPYVEFGGVVTTFEPPGEPLAGAIFSAINNKDKVVGYSQTSPPQFPLFGWFGWTYENGVVSALPLIPIAINNGGVILGGIEKPPLAGGQGVIYQNGALTPVVVPESLSTTVIALNNPGHVAGNYSLSSDTDSRVRHGFVYSNGHFTNIDYPGAISTLVVDINDKDTVAGQYVIQFRNEGPPILGGFIFQNGHYINIPLPSDAVGIANVAGVNNQGVVVGNYGSSSRQRGFVYVNGKASPFDFPASQPIYSTVITGINNNGEIVGTAPAVATAFTATPGGSGTVSNPTFSFNFVGQDFVGQ